MTELTLVIVSFIKEQRTARSHNEKKRKLRQLGQ